MTKAQRRSLLAASRWNLTWRDKRFVELPHHVRVLQVGATDSIAVTGRGGRRNRRRRRAVELHEFLMWKRSYVIARTEDDMPF